MIVATRYARTRWERAAKLLRGGDRANPPPSPADRDRARRELQAAVAADPGMADAWLGLHYLDVDRSAALRAMSRHPDRFGQERRRTNLALASRFDGGTYWSQRLETHDELFLAVATALAGDDKPDRELAHTYLDRITTVDLLPCRDVLRGTLRFQPDDWAGAIPPLHAAADSKASHWVRAEARLLLGISLYMAGVPEQAELHLRHLLNNAPSRALRAEAAFWCGRVREDAHDQPAARHAYSICYATNPSYGDVAERLSAAPPQQVQAAAAQPEQPESEPAPAPPQPSLDEALTDLNRLIGLEPVKRQVRTLVAQLRMDQARAARGMKVATLSHHLVFTGPPGTGKTTVARQLARIYAALGLLESGTLVETGRTDLVGEHLGATALKTRHACETASGGVLFIDEAYQLRLDGIHGGDAYGTEAIGELIAQMENNRSGLVVIAAGYRDDMDRFLAANEGLRSRFGTTIDFGSYAPDELLAILDRLADHHGDTLTLDARALALGIFDQTCTDRTIDALGNGRYARNLYEHAVRHRALRHEHANLDDLADEQLSTLTEEDLRTAARTLVAPTGRATGATGG